jgi:chorismate mutase/prephenate dehydrogenase
MSLDELRTELGSVDQRLLELIARRQKLASKIGEVKRAAGIPTRDYRQERDVIQRARAAADKYGVSADFSEQLMVMLIRSSLTVQERDQVAAHGSGSGKRVLIIGGCGNMGRWFVRFMSSQGYEVEVADPSGEVPGITCVADWRDTDLSHDIIVVAAPMAISNGILTELAERKPAGVVFDIGSLKSPMRAGLRALVDAGVQVTSIHPMFGPNTELLSHRHVIFVDLGSDKATQTARDLFSSTMAVQVDMDLESHDRLIAYVLGLSHALNIAFFTALAESGEAAPKLAEISSTTFDAQLDVARRVADESPELYFEIQNLTDDGTESLSALLHAVERLRSVIRAGDEAGFVKLMQQGRSYLDSRDE